MPKYWYDRDANRTCDVPDEEEREFRLRVLADKKPYFMRYIYPALNKQYTTYINNTKKKCLREFRVGIDELLRKPKEELTEDERGFLYYYRAKVPVGDHACVMNRICWRFEREFDGYMSKYAAEDEFDYSIMQSGAEYSDSQFRAVEKVYDEYVGRVRDFSRYAKVERIDKDDGIAIRSMIVDDFRRMCYEVCSDRAVLCDILLDVCYKREGTKQLVWDVVGDVIVENLLRRHNGEIMYPIQSPDGDVWYGGERFTFVSKVLREEEDDVDHFEREGICGECDTEQYDRAEACGDAW